jgi:hypothetical protein
MGNVSPNTAPRDPFANYGYGPNANMNFQGQNGSSPGSTFAAPSNLGMQGQPSLSLNTSNLGLNALGPGMSPTINTGMNFPASAITQQQAAAQLQAQANLFNYNMLNMGLMNYPLSAGPMSALSPSQVRSHVIVRIRRY